MKKIYLLLLIVVFFMLFINITNAQNKNSITFENTPESSIDLIHQGIKESGIRVYNYNFQNHTGTSHFFEYTSLMIKNRAKYEIKYLDGSFIIQLVERQYLSENKWVKNVLPLSKKIRKKHLESLEVKVNILINESLKNPSINEVVKKESAPKKQPNLFDEIEKDTYLVFTEDSLYQVIAMHKSGAYLAVQLKEDGVNPASIIYKDTVMPYSIVLYFNENNQPYGGTYGDYVLRFSSKTDSTMDVAMLLTDGTVVSQKGIEIEKENKQPNSVGLSPPVVEDISKWFSKIRIKVSNITCGLKSASFSGQSGDCLQLPCIVPLYIAYQEMSYNDYMEYSKSLDEEQKERQKKYTEGWMDREIKNNERIKVKDILYEYNQTLEYGEKKAVSLKELDSYDYVKAKLTVITSKGWKGFKSFLGIKLQNLEISGRSEVYPGDTVKYKVTSNVYKNTDVYYSGFTWGSTVSFVEIIPYTGQHETQNIAIAENSFYMECAVWVKQTVDGVVYKEYYNINIIRYEPKPEEYEMTIFPPADDATNDGYYYKCILNLSVPTIIDYLHIEKLHTSEKGNVGRDQHSLQNISYVISCDSTRKNGNLFWGKTVSHTMMSYTETRTFIGKLSKDGRWIKELDIEVIYLQDNPGHQESQRFYIHLKNIPVHRAYVNNSEYKQYSYRCKTIPSWKENTYLPESVKTPSSITSIKYITKQLLNRTSYSDETFKRLKSINYDLIKENCGNLRFNVTLKRLNLIVK